MIALTRSIRMAYIFLMIGRIYGFHLKYIYLKNQRHFTGFCSIFAVCIKFGTFRKKNDPHSLSISEIINSERRGYLNALKVLFLKTLPVLE